MNISILNPPNTVPTSTPIDEKTLFNLSIDRIFRHICPNKDRREYFLKVISELNCDNKMIEFRGEILKDFLIHKEMFDELFAIYSRFEELRSSLKSSLKPDTRMDFSYNTSITSKKNELRAYSLAFKRSLCFVRSIGEIISKYDIKSDGLNLLLNECRRIYVSGSFETLLSMCSKYEYLSERGILDFKYTLTENMKIDSFEFADHRYIHISNPDSNVKKRFLFKKKAEKKYICQRIFKDDNRSFTPLISGAFGDMASLFKGLTDQIFRKFLGIGSELDFYYVALKYVEILNAKKVVYTFPSIATNENISIDSLYDLFLIIQKDDCENIVANSYNLSNGLKGLIIYGNNGCGKTVYMRAFGIMQILAQAGLPVPCRYAEIKLYTKIISQYAESENHTSLEDFGRFESEVNELSNIVDSIKEGSLILLNETFQSTLYEEGAIGLWNILKYFIRWNSTFILVSHLHDLKKMIVSEKIGILHCHDRYKFSQTNVID